MTEENENIEETTEAPVEPESTEETPAEAEVPAEESAAEEAPADEPAAEEAPEPVAEEPAAEPEAAVAEEAPAEEAPPEEPVAEVPAPEVESGGEVSDEPGRDPAASPPDLAAIAEETPAAEVETAPAAEAAPAAPQAQSEPKKKSKRLPRSLRPQKTRPSRPVATGDRKPIVRLPKPEHDRGRRQERRGVVVSSAMDKTIVVKVDVITSHQRYKKVIRRSVKFHAHDEQNAASVGDIVRIIETRPLSKTKHWRLAEIVEAAK